MRKWYFKLQVAEFAFVCCALASFGVVGIAGLLFGFQFANWSEWQGRLVGVTATIAGVVSAAIGIRMALDAEPTTQKRRTIQVTGRHKHL